jgi:hypothetical protein
MQDPIYDQYYDDYVEQMYELHTAGLVPFKVWSNEEVFTIWAESDITAGIAVLNSGRMPTKIVEYLNPKNK